MVHEKSSKLTLPGASNRKLSSAVKNIFLTQSKQQVHYRMKGKYLKYIILETWIKKLRLKPIKSINCRWIKKIKTKYQIDQWNTKRYQKASFNVSVMNDIPINKIKSSAQVYFQQLTQIICHCVSTLDFLNTLKCADATLPLKNTTLLIMK